MSDHSEPLEEVRTENANVILNLYEEYKRNFHLVDKEGIGFIESDSRQFQLIDEKGNFFISKLSVRATVKDKVMRIMVMLVPPTADLSKLVNLYDDDQLLSLRSICLAHKSFNLSFDSANSTINSTISYIRVEKEKIPRGIGIGTALFSLSEEIRDSLAKVWAKQNKAKHLVSKVSDASENPGKGFTARYIRKYLTGYSEDRRNKGSFTSKIDL